MKKGLYITLTILLLLTFGHLNSNAQAQRFKAGLILGVNASQIDGDLYAGYDKLGLMGGLRGVTIFTDKIEFSVELLYSQRGSQSELIAGNNFPPFKLKTNYIEVPVLFNYLDWMVEEDDETYHKIHLAGGLSYGRLISSSIEADIANTDFLNGFKKDDISLAIGATFYATPHFGFTFRWNRSLGLLAESNGSATRPRSLRGKHLTFHLLYML